MESEEFIDCHLRGTTGCVKQVGEFCERCPMTNYMRSGDQLMKSNPSAARAIEQLEAMKKKAEEYVAIFKESKMESSELCSKAMMQAYNNAIEKLKNLK